MAMTTLSSCPPVCMRAASCARRASSVVRTAARSTWTAAARRTACSVVVASWRKKKPAPLSWEAKDFLKRSRESSLCRIWIAWLMAPSSPVRSTWRACHSTFLSAKADFTWPMYFTSLATSSVSLPFSSTDSSLDMPLAPFSFFMSRRACDAEVSSLVFEVISVSYSVWAFASAPVASWRFMVNSSRSLARTPWILKERAL
mmetsp:Transcript_20727/g.54918  ORF Transcript_20727/g.54918 Transcript_20727/m.54918 type:complete len:201 (+) Transcript_20727:1009-1611(+)